MMNEIYAYWTRLFLLYMIYAAIRSPSLFMENHQGDSIVDETPEGLGFSVHF